MELYLYSPLHALIVWTGTTYFFQYIYQTFVYLPPVFPTKGRMDETVGEQLSSLVNVSTCLHGVAQDFMYYSHITSFGFIVAWTQEWNMK